MTPSKHLIVLFVKSFQESFESSIQTSPFSRVNNIFIPLHYGTCDCVHGKV